MVTKINATLEGKQITFLYDVKTNKLHIYDGDIPVCSPVVQCTEQWIFDTTERCVLRMEMMRTITTDRLFRILRNFQPM